MATNDDNFTWWEFQVVHAACISKFYPRVYIADCQVSGATPLHSSASGPIGTGVNLLIGKKMATNNDYFI